MSGLTHPWLLEETQPFLWSLMGWAGRSFWKEIACSHQAEAPTGPPMRSQCGGHRWRMRPETCLVQSLKEKGSPSTKPQVLVVGKELLRSFVAWRNGLGLSWLCPIPDSAWEMGC